MNQPHLEIRTPQGTRLFPLEARPVTIGRHRENMLVLDEPRASRFHCIIWKADDGFHFRDLGSTNCTLINGQPLRSAQLKNDDLIVIGSVRIRLVAPAADAGANRDSSEAESITEADAIEELTEADLADAPPPPRHEAKPAGPARLDDLAYLQVLATSLNDGKFTEADVTFVNARGSVVHGSQTDVSDRGQETVGLLRLLMLVCLRIHATDIHVEPRNTDYQLRIRVDGIMIDLIRLSRETGVRLTSLVKILADVDIAQRNVVQEGRFAVRVPDRRVDCRLSFAPAMFGQKLVARIFDAAATPLRLWDLQLPARICQDLEKTIRRDTGMVLACGPTGSGKTTTLYAMLRSIDIAQRNVTTIEDPVEIQLEGITQIPVNEAQDNTFPSLLRSVLRQDPDVILVGEIRDAETARIAMQAAMTGHMVFSTLHSRNAVGAVFRLLDLGIEPYALSQGLNRVVAQRLVRQLCPHCKVAGKPTSEQLRRMESFGLRADVIYSPGQCARCLHTGHAGRRAVFELLTLNDPLREALLKSPTAQELSQIADKTGFQSMLNAGYRLVVQGVTSLAEIEHMLGDQST